ncbi:TraX family protein [Gryllotalpicola daejeonensis]|uniref:TraX family protein n=1 Tax=Gryllotalpicola daejeonensis TaxID=993087 RepID=A0ABP7ZM32_9MICO
MSAARLRVVGFVLVALGAVSSAIAVAQTPAAGSAVDMSTLTRVVLLEAVSWAAVPIFAWLLWRGFRRAQRRGRYALWLALLAVVTELPYDLATSGRAWDPSSQNPVFALLIGFIVMWALDHLLRGPRRNAGVAVLVCIAGILWLVIFDVGVRLGIVPMGVVLLLFCLVFYFLHSRENTMMMVGGTLGALALIFPALGMLLLHFRRDESGDGATADSADSIAGDSAVAAGSPLFPLFPRDLLYGLYPLGLLVAGLIGVLS